MMSPDPTGARTPARTDAPARPLRRFLRPAPAAPTPTETDRRMMRHALTLARHAASIGEVPVGAVVWDLASGEIIATGFNTRERDHAPHAHAEHTAIVRAARRLGDWRLTGLALAVTLEPCPMCAGLIVNARLDRVVYGAPDPKAGACRSLYRLLDDPRLNHRRTPIAGVLAAESAAMLKQFFKDRRAKKPTSLFDGANAD